MLRTGSIKGVSTTEHVGDIPTAKLTEAVVESVDQFYSEKLFH